MTDKKPACPRAFCACLRVFSSLCLLFLLPAALDTGPSPGSPAALDTGPSPGSPAALDTGPSPWLPGRP